MKAVSFISIAICLSISCIAKTTKHASSSRFTSYHNLVMAGYQGWFNTPDDGANRRWNHYSGRDGFKDGSCSIDFWPDVSEYEKVYPTPFTHADGTTAYLYSSYDASSVDLHFKWMQQYGIDGAFMQRFISDIKRPPGYRHNNTVLANALNSAEKYHRAICVMYDFSGMQDSDSSTVVKDWKMLVDSLQVTSRGKKQSYLYHNGKPLVVLWGVGFSDGRRYGLQTIEKLVDFFKNDPVYGQCSVMLGVPTYWRDFGRDTEKDPHLHDVLRKADIIQPWFIGRYNEDTYSNFEGRIKDDIAWCSENQLDYVPTIFPGFSWHNMKPASPSNQIPRNRGRFFWKQLKGAIASGSKMLYISMFDEVDEGTAIFKTSKNPPVGQSRFVSIEDDIPNDYYLYLAGFAGKMLRKKVPFQEAIPAPIKQN